MEPFHHAVGLRADHRDEVNWTPLSLVITAGTPNLEIHPWNMAEAHSTAEMCCSVLILSLGQIHPYLNSRFPSKIDNRLKVIGTVSLAWKSS